MQNDFLQRRILPKCFISDPSRISMEARAKENFSPAKEKSDNRYIHTSLLYLILRKYSTEKTKFSFRKRKSPENLFERFSGNRDYSFTMVTEAILWGLRGLSDQLVFTPAMRSSTSKPSVSLPKAA